MREKKSIIGRVLRASYHSRLVPIGNVLIGFGRRASWSWVALKAMATPQPGERGIVDVRCPLCGFPKLIRLRNGDSGVRCIRCFGGVTQMSTALAIKRRIKDLSSVNSYELSTGGPLYSFLSARCESVTGSEYLPDVEPGQWKGRTQCQNIECLTYQDSSFGLVTSTEVFEHVANDLKGFKEVRRVLVEGGYFIFTVPLLLNEKTIERAKMVEGNVVHIEEPEYHDDSIRGAGKVLAFRTYGVDILERLKTAGFKDAEIDTTNTVTFDGGGRAVVIAHA